MKNMYLSYVWNIFICVYKRVENWWLYNKERVSILRTLKEQRPSIFKQKLAALIYPGIWGIYYSLSRYIRIGETYNIFDWYIINYMTEEIIIILLVGIPNIIVYIRIIFAYLAKIREILWDYTAGVAHYYHLQFLLYNVYFYLFYKLYKLRYLIFDIFILTYGGATFLNRENAPKFFRLTSYLYFKPWIITIFFFSLIVLEVIIKQGELYYSIYILFLYPFLFGIFKCFNAMMSSDIFKDTCMSEYIYQRFSYAKPRFSNKFALYSKNPMLFYNIRPCIFIRNGQNELDSILNLAQEQNFKTIQRRTQLNYRMHGIRHTVDNLTSTFSRSNVPCYSKHYCLRVSGNFLVKKNIRWFSTTKPCCAPGSKIHPVAVALAIKKSPLNILSCLHHPLTEYPIIEKLVRKLPKPIPEDIYAPLPNKNILLNPQSSVASIMEANFVMRFHPLTESGVVIGTYEIMKQIYGYPKNDIMQMRPDLLAYFVNSTYSYRSYLGIDQKVKFPSNFGRNQAITYSFEEYNTLISQFEERLAEKGMLTETISMVLVQLVNSCNNPGEHIRIWALYIDLFEASWRPPLRLVDSFDYSNLKPNIREMLVHEESKLQGLSDYLNKKNIPRNIQDPEDLFCDSQIQEWMR